MKTIRQVIIEIIESMDEQMIYLVHGLFFAILKRLFLLRILRVFW